VNLYDTTVKTLNKSWNTNKSQIEEKSQELNNAIDFTYKIWGKNAFRKWKDNAYQGRFNRAVFDIMVYYFSNPEARDALQSYSKDIEAKFRQLCEEDSEFLNSFETSTKNLQPTSKRYTVWGEALQEITGYDMTIPKID
jgi:hypothetical protein